MKTQKGFATVVVGIIIALAILGAAGYWHYEYKKIAKDTNQNSKKLDTSNWKTYTNKTYGWSIKYPSDWEATNTGNYEPEDVEAPMIRGPIDCFENNKRCGTVEIGPIGYQNSPVAKEIKESNISAKERYKYDHNYNDPSRTVLEEKDITFNGVEAYEVTDYVKNIRSHVSKIIYFRHGDIIFYVGLVEDGKDAESIKTTEDWKLNDYYNTILSTFKFENSQATSTGPVIESISPVSGPVGTIIVIKGKNLAGFEGDLDAWIENSKGEIAVVSGINSVYPRTDQITVKIGTKICKQNNSYSGLPCTSYMDITPGKYLIYTAPWGKNSNKVEFTVANDTSTWKIYKNEKYGFEISYPNNFIIGKNNLASQDFGGLDESNMFVGSFSKDIFKGTNLYEVSVYAGSKIKDPQICESKSGKEGAAGSSYFTDIRAFKTNDKCFEIFMVAHSFNDIQGHNDINPNDQVKAYTKDSLENVFNQIVSTFKFMN